MRCYLLVKNNLKSFFTLRQVTIIICLMIIFIYSSIQLIENTNIDSSIYLVSSLNGSLNFVIQGKFSYILNQFIVISLFGNYLFFFIRYKLQYHILRIGNIFKWFISLIITIFITITLYYILLTCMFYIYLILFKNDTFFKLYNQLNQSCNRNILINTIIINILNSTMYVLLNIFLVVIIKNNILPYIILLVVQLIGIFLSIYKVDIAKFLPTTQVLITSHSNVWRIYFFLITFIIIIIYTLNRYISKNLLDIINIREE